MERLFATLRQRRRPEDVAQMILELRDRELTQGEAALLQKAARGALKRQMFGSTSMPQEFARPVGMQKQAAKAAQLFVSATPPPAALCESPAAMETFVRDLGQEIQKAYGRSHFLYDRLNKEARKAAGLDVSKRRYNKLFRHLRRMEAKSATLTRELQKREFQQIGKAGLAHRLSWESFAADPDAACFVAYYAARCRLRSEFTVFGQQRPFDEIAAMLLARCQRSRAANWQAIASVYPSQETLGHLTDAQKGELLAQWFALLQDIGSLLAQLWEQNSITRATMIVGRGNDSTTWNNTAGAWNKARDNWMELVYALGLESLLERLCFGKTLRLMAADVVAWHRSAGGGLDPNTVVWNEVPLPWEVLSGRAACNKAQIEAACGKAGLDAEKSGWVAPRPRTQIAPFRPTPELVHGVTVSSPHLAALLRKAGYFSGKA